MVFKQQFGLLQPKTLTCPECGLTRFRVAYNKVECTNCGWTEKVASNKYGAKRTTAKDGVKRDSKFEATNADMLALRVRAGDIKAYDSQFKVEIWIYREDGPKAFSVKHKVDFRIHHNDGSFELVEAKGVETADWKWRRRLLEELWLPLHKDHIYTVVKQSQFRYNR